MLPLGGGGGMLFAARHELESDTRVQLLSIQQRELEFFLNACYYIARLSALIAGYAYTALIYTKYIDADLCDPDEILCAEMNYPFCLTLTFGLSTYCLWGAMLITFLAPAMALRGPQGSVQECVAAHAIPLYQAKEVRFHSAGREDVDVRMLGSGRYVRSVSL